MFGLFGGKKDAPNTAVAPELGATLRPQTMMPATGPAPAAPSCAESHTAHLHGFAPDGSWVDSPVSGQTQSVFIVPGCGAQPPLAVVRNASARMQMWELSAETPPRFLKQRQVSLEPGQASWLLYSAKGVACLPGQQLAVAVRYTDPNPKQALYVYARERNQFRRIETIESELSGPPPFSAFETLALASDARLVKYRTGAIRIGEGNYVYQHNHLLLFSARYPAGLQILKLGIGDGNIHAWAVRDKVLWLHTRDKRKQGQDGFWSLDLSRVL